MLHLPNLPILESFVGLFFVFCFSTKLLRAVKPSELPMKSRGFGHPVLSIYYVIKVGGRSGMPNAYSVLQRGGGGSERPQIVLRNK